jgi:hypothetical protein
MDDSFPHGVDSVNDDIPPYVPPRERHTLEVEIPGEVQSAKLSAALSHNDVIANCVFLKANREKNNVDWNVHSTKLRIQVSLKGERELGDVTAQLRNEFKASILTVDGTEL